MPFRTILRSRVYAAASSLAVMIGLGTWIFRVLEDWTWAESFYFTVATITTVGYGDLHPTSDSSRVVASLFILFGVAVAITALTSIGSEYARRRDRMLQRYIHKIEKDVEDKK